MNDQDDPPVGHEWTVDFFGFNPLAGVAPPDPAQPAAQPEDSDPTTDQMTGAAPIPPAPGASLIKSAPDGLLKRSIDGQEYWAPAPLQTIGGMDKPAVNEGWINDYFTFYDLAAPDGGSSRDACRFNGAETTVAEIVATLGEQAVLADYKPDPGRATSIATAIVAHRAASGQAGEKISESPASDLASPVLHDQGTQVVGAVGGQVSGHWRLDRKLKAADPPVDGTVQFQFGLNQVMHPENMTGKEFQPQLTVQYNVVTKQWTILDGGQITYVAAVWGRVQLQLVGSAGGGIADKLSGGGTANGVFTVQLGPQLTVTVGPVQLSLQATTSTTITSGPPTLDGNVAFQVSLSKDLDEKAPGPDKDDLDISALQDPNLPMPDMLDMLDVVHAKGKTKNVPAGQGERLDVAILTVEREWAKSDEESKAFYDRVGKLPSNDQDAIRGYIYKRI